MDIANVVFWPFIAAFWALMIAIGALFFIFWVWMIIDCAKRKFKDDTEKIVWIVVIALCNWIGALIYFIIIKVYNPEGLNTKQTKSKKYKKQSS